MLRSLIILFTLTIATIASAEAPRILDVEVSRAGMGWRFDVSLEHPDTGWDHYADGWELIDAAGTVIGYRELMHPHVEEQPFARSLNNVMLPDGMEKIWVRARCSEDGWAGETYEVTLP